MGLQTERITILGTPEFKAFLVEEAEKEGVSVGELVRQRCSGSQNNKEEKMLVSLTAELRQITAKATASLERGLKDAENVLTELREIK